MSTPSQSALSSLFAEPGKRKTQETPSDALLQEAKCLGIDIAVRNMCSKLFDHRSPETLTGWQSDLLFETARELIETAAKSSEYNVRFELEDVQCGDAGDIGRVLLDAWYRSGGRLTDDINSFAPYLVFMDGKPYEEEDSPKILHCGEESLVVRELGKVLQSGLPVTKDLFSENYRRMCSRAYLTAALTNQPVFDFVHASDPFSVGPKHALHFRRLLLPVHDDQGVRVTLCYASGPCVSHV